MTDREKLIEGVQFHPESILTERRPHRHRSRRGMEAGPGGAD